jgi:hypothetical protein
VFEGLQNGAYLYRFESEGKYNITKQVGFFDVGIPNLYNLGFGNLEIKNGEKFVDDNSDVNNNDFNRVLSTVFSCAIHFLNNNSDARILFFGNTQHKHTLYIRKIAANYSEISKLFSLFGGVLHHKRDLVDRSVQDRVIRDKDMDGLIFGAEAIKDIERFEIQNCRNYDFIIISS